MFEIRFVAVQSDGDAADEDGAVDLVELARGRWEVRGVLDESSIDGFSYTLVMQRVMPDARWLDLEQAMRAGFRLAASYNSARDMVKVLAERGKPRVRTCLATCEKATLAEALLELPIQSYLV